MVSGFIRPLHLAARGNSIAFPNQIPRKPSPVGPRFAREQHCIPKPNPAKSNSCRTSLREGAASQSQTKSRGNRGPTFCLCTTSLCEGTASQPQTKSRGNRGPTFCLCTTSLCEGTASQPQTTSRGNRGPTSPDNLSNLWALLLQGLG